MRLPKEVAWFLAALVAAQVALDTAVILLGVGR